MSSPVEFLLITELNIVRQSDLPIYVQVSNGITQLITSGKLLPGQKLPGSRSLASQLNLHRKTINMAFDELLQQGFLESIPQKGTYVASHIPKLDPQSWSAVSHQQTAPKAGFDFHQHKSLKFPYLVHKTGLVIDEGLPDLRLSPIEDIQRTYRNMLSRTYQLKHWSYGSPYGDEWLREEYAKYLRNTRGLLVNAENVLITRGSQMAIYLASVLMLNQGAKVGVGHLNYQTANYTLVHFGAELVHIPVDEHGMNTEMLEDYCQKNQLTAVYVTPHHHHPTTATLSADRRMHLLQLSKQYGFAIIEDDYDYDFHYERSPLLPLASVDQGGQVVYIGGLSKIISPALRIGFLVGPSDFIESAAYYRRIMDRQGDSIMERAIAQLMANGDLARHSKKALKVYRERRDAFAEHLDQLSESLNYQKPSGGMAFWVGFDKSRPLADLSKQLKKEGLEITNWENYDPHKQYHNHIRMGFASLNEEERRRAFEILERVLNRM
ncbi:MAG: PLP-dependent aminotransferase family protein [Cytophagales bacterium]|nr:PLP-dependent aminotransferase family protein [Cytophagales bacterium]